MYNDDFLAKSDNSHTTVNIDFLFFQILPVAGGGDLRVELLL
jgi:hypothetical protein